MLYSGIHYVVVATILLRENSIKSAAALINLVIFRVTHHRAGMLGNLKMTLECTQAHERHVHYRVPFAVFLRLFKGF